MSGYSLTIRPSRLRQQSLLLLALILVWLVLTWPLSGTNTLLVWLIFTVWGTLWWWVWRQPQKQQVLFVNDQGQLHWLGDHLPAGNIHANSRISPLVIFLCWQDPFGIKRQHWLFVDQLTADDYRTLARVLNTLSWQRSTSKSS